MVYAPAVAGRMERVTTAEAAGYRIERDTMGEVQVPAEALWRAQTQRAVQNFPISGRGLEPAHIRALARIKGAAAQVNGELGVVDREVAAAIATAAAHVADGGYDDQFPVDVFQTGSGTSSNMNANEVIATLASRELGRDVHPNDDVNASQSSNDVFPSSIHLAATEHMGRIVFLHTVNDGPASQSYGIQVARLAGVPAPVLARARRKLAELETAAAHAGDSRQGDLFRDGTANDGAARSSLVPAPDLLRERLANVEPDTLTPRDALALLYELKSLADAGGER